MILRYIRGLLAGIALALNSEHSISYHYFFGHGYQYGNTYGGMSLPGMRFAR
jgi:hypothetical protein